MKKYNYFEAVKNDVMTYINENYEKEAIELHTSDEYADEFAEILFDKLWIEDSVTGNTSGSYTMNTWVAEENLCHNLDLLCEAYEKFGGVTLNLALFSAEYADVTIRCYLLSRAISRAIEDIQNRISDEKIEREVK